MLAVRPRGAAAVGGPSMGAGRGRARIAAVALAVVLSMLVGPLPLVPLPGPVGSGAVALVCGTTVDAATAAPDAAAGTAALQVAVDGAATADPTCPAWTVTLTGTFDLAGDLVHRAAVPLVLAGPEGGRAELRGSGTARILTLLRPATEVTLRRLVLRGGRAAGTDLDGAGGAVGAEIASLADPTPSRVTVEDALIAGSTAAMGGAVAADEVVLTDVDLVANAATLGGAVDAGAVVATRTQFVANTATLPLGQGGAVRSTGDVTLTNVTFTGNAATSGGSVWVSGAADPVLRATATTFADAAADAGGHVHGDLTLGGRVRVVLRGSVLTGVAALTPAGPVPSVCTGVVAHAGPGPDVSVASLATDATCPGVAVLDVPPALVPLDGPEGVVEGRVRLVAPAASGPLVDVAACGGVWPTEDARGVARPQPADAACDAGAVEVVVAAPPVDPPPGDAPSGEAPSDDAGHGDAPADARASVVPTPVPAAVRSGDATERVVRRSGRSALAALLDLVRRR